MPTAITKYYIDRISSGMVQVTIYDPTSYASYSVYVDDLFAVERTETVFLLALAPNQKLDILGLASADSGKDFNETLDDSNGDKAELVIPSSFLGSTVKVFSDGGSGTINYASPVAIVDTAEADFVEETTDLSWEEFTYDEWMAFTDAEWDAFLTDSGFLEIYHSARLAPGTYKYGVKAYNAAFDGTAYETTVTISTRPDENVPSIFSYNKSTDVVALKANVTDSGTRFWHIYIGSWNGDKSTVDTTSIAHTSSSPLITFTGLRGVHTSGSVWLLVRESKGGLEEQNWNWLQFTVVGSDWVGNLPSSPTNLTATVATNNQVVLVWQYPVASSTPDGFKVYSDGGTGTVDYTAPIATLTNKNKGFVSYTASTISATSKFGVRAYKGSNTDGNTVTVTAVPYGTPATLTATANETWRDE